MKELLRITHGMQDQAGEDALYDYNLEVYEGEILYIQGMPGNGIRTLMNIFAGDCALKSGKLLLNGKEVSGYNRDGAFLHGIYTITAERDLVETLTVAENLEAIRYLPFSGSLYNRKRSTRRVKKYLEQEGVHISAEDYVWTIGSKDRKRLSILKAKMHGARLIILDAMNELYEGKEAEEICSLIQKANREGITFVILTQHYNMLAEIADRIQLVSRGIDLKEWRELSDRIRNVLRDPMGYQQESGKPGSGAGQKCFSGFLGLYDYEWETEREFRNYLVLLRRENEALWNAEIWAELPEKGFVAGRGTVLIPQDSAEKLLMNLSIADNLILPIPRRVSRSCIGLIPKHIEKNIADRFYTVTGVDAAKTEICELDRVERKILSIYRWAASHPKVMILERPYSGFHPEEVQRIRNFLQDLEQKGIRIIYFSKAFDEMQLDCEKILISHNGRSAKMTTPITFFSTPE